MRFLKSYFDEDSSLKKLNNEFLEYENYLEKNRDCFDEQTYHILKNLMIILLKNFQWIFFGMNMIND